MLEQLLHDRSSGLHLSTVMGRYKGQHKRIGDNGRSSLLGRPAANAGICDADEASSSVHSPYHKLRYKGSAHNACPPAICLDENEHYCDFDDTFAYHGQWKKA